MKLRSNCMQARTRVSAGFQPVLAHAMKVVVWRGSLSSRKCSFAGDTLWTAHAGDSRAVMSRAGRAVRLTEDHKPHLAAERARIEANGGRVEFQRCWRVICGPRDGRPGSGLAVSRSFGDLDFKEFGCVALAGSDQMAYHVMIFFPHCTQKASIGSTLVCPEGAFLSLT